MPDAPPPAGPGSTFAVDVASMMLDAGDPLDRSTVLDGSPEVHEALLWASEDGRVLRGVWQITPGTVTDVEQDEVFVVIAGRATVQVEDGATLDLEPGTMAVLARGARTTWIVHETLRKVFQVTMPA